MSLSFDQKKAVVGEVSAAIAAPRTGVLAAYRGLSVAELTALRREARREGVWVKVVKNNLAKRAVAESDFACLSEHFTGPVLFSVSEDPVAVARVMAGFAKEYEHLQITAAAMNGVLVDTDMIDRLATLPRRDQLIARLLATMQSPLQKFAATLNEVPTRCTRVLTALVAANKT